MKKLYIAILSCLPLLASAQSITQADLPGAGTAWTMANDTNISTVSAGGMGQTWDYSTLQNHYEDTTGFTSASGTPYAGMFPTSNLAGHDPLSGTYTYFTSSSTGFYVDGVVSPSFALVFDSPQLGIPVPFAFGDVRSNTARMQIDSSIVDSSGTPLNLRFVLRIDDSFSADATGSLTTPSGVYPSVLRIKDTQVVYDSIYIDSGLGFYLPVSGRAAQSTTYQFVTSGMTVNRVMVIEADSLGGNSIITSYLKDATLAVPSISRNQNTVLYPNPVSGTANFMNLQDYTGINIYDNSGKIVYNSTVINNGQVNLETLPNGVYQYEILQKGGSQKGSFVIQR